jgi:hypothetical protein
VLIWASCGASVPRALVPPHSPTFLQQARFSVLTAPISLHLTPVQVHTLLRLVQSNGGNLLSAANWSQLVMAAFWASRRSAARQDGAKAAFLMWHVAATSHNPSSASRGGGLQLWGQLHAVCD